MIRENEYIRFDWAMKHMLRDKANFGILEGLISVLIKDDVKIQEILESESNQDTESDKFNRVDVKAVNSKGHIIIVEVQLTRQLYYLQRILYGTSKAITEHINLGDDYDKVRKVYSISILYCEYGRGNDYVYHGVTNFTGLHTGDELVALTKDDRKIVPMLPRAIFPEYYLIRVNTFDKLDSNTPLDEWLHYLKTGIIKEDTRTPGLQQVKEKLRILSMTTPQRRAYDDYIDNIRVQNDVLGTAKVEGYIDGHESGLAEGRAEGLAEGRAEGRAEERAAMIRTMAQNGLDISVIAKSLGMTEDEVNSLL